MDHHGIIIMHIEDNDEYAHLVSSAISQSNLNPRVIRLLNAESGLDYLFGELQALDRENYPTPDIIILGLSLPHRDGLEFLKIIRRNQLTGGIPVIVLSTSNREEDISEAYKFGANSYIVKPDNLQDFIVKLAEVNMYWSLTSEIPKTASTA